TIDGKDRTVLDDSDIAAMLKSQISQGKLHAVDDNTLYVVFVGPNVGVTNGDENSFTNFVGYHNVTKDSSGNKIFYAVILDPTGHPGHPPLGPPTSPPTPQSHPAVASHETAEAAPPPTLTEGWRARDSPAPLLGDEIGDTPQHAPREGTATGFALDGYAVQK